MEAGGVRLRRHRTSVRTHITLTTHLLFLICPLLLYPSIKSNNGQYLSLGKSKNTFYTSVSSLSMNKNIYRSGLKTLCIVDHS